MKVKKVLGIANIDKYADLFGIGQKTGINLSGEKDGTVPSPDWKAATFKMILGVLEIHTTLQLVSMVFRLLRFRW